MTMPISTTSAVGCSGCNLRASCLPDGLSGKDIELIENLIPAHRVIRRGSPLFRSGDPLEAFYVIRLGFIKTTVTLNDGREQVVGFHMAGDILGFDAVGGDIHVCDAVALEDTEVCVIPYKRFNEIAAALPSLHRHVHEQMSLDMNRLHGIMLMLGSMHADERLASFLLQLSQRYEARGFSRTEFVLRMTRAEIGSYLGLKLETVSRVLSRFSAMKLIEVNQKHVRILDAKGLRALISCGQGLE